MPAADRPFSRPWNPRVARAFYLRGIIEEWGRGATARW